MASADDILAYVDAIVDRFGPQRIVLFGSYAYGTPTPDSDVDLLIETAHRGAFAKSVRIRKELPATFPLDLLVKSPADVRWRLAERDMFVETIFKQGFILHEALDKRVGREGRRRLRKRLKASEVASEGPKQLPLLPLSTVR